MWNRAKAWSMRGVKSVHERTARVASAQQPSSWFNIQNVAEVSLEKIKLYRMGVIGPDWLHNTELTSSIDHLTHCMFVSMQTEVLKGESEIESRTVTRSYYTYYPNTAWNW